MKKLKDWTFSVIILSVSVLTILFDPDGMQLGLQLWPTISHWVVGTAEFLGNFLWLLGLLFLVSAALLAAIVAYFDEFEKHMKGKIRSTYKETGKITSKNDIFSLQTKIMLAVNGVMAIIATGSGYWFYGPSTLAFVVAIWSFNNYMICITEETNKDLIGTLNNES